MWNFMKKGPLKLEQLPINDRVFYFQVTTKEGEFHLSIDRYSKNQDLTQTQLIFIDWDQYLKVQIMKTHSRKFKQ
jgi:hypothetical protein